VSATLINNGSLLFSGIWAFCETIVIFTVAFKFFARMNKRLDRIEYQLYENGGGSMKDQINCISDDVTELKINQAVIKAKLENQ
jgi:cellulose synthase/poly-beta-1,6-N-acetylglucosamine synthase-like glycosyltransferase